MHFVLVCKIYKILTWKLLFIISSVYKTSFNQILITNWLFIISSVCRINIFIQILINKWLVIISSVYRTNLLNRMLIPKLHFIISSVYIINLCSSDLKIAQIWVPIKYSQKQYNFCSKIICINYFSVWSKHNEIAVKIIYDIFLTDIIVMY